MFHQVWYQSILKATGSGVLEDLTFKISAGSDQNWCFSGSALLAVSAKLRQLTGQTKTNHQFWSEPSEILNLRFSTTPETVAFTPP